MSERHHRGSLARRRAHEAWDKTLLRLPAPFYRLPDRTIAAGPAAAQVSLLVPQEAWDVHWGRIAVGMRLVLGWRIARKDCSIGYYVKMDNGYPTLERTGQLPDEDEGISWVRAWDDEEKQRALLAAAALR